MSSVFYDIETIPLPLAQREHMRPNPWEFKTGNLKDPEKLKVKRAEMMKAWDKGEDAALDPMLGRIALIGMCVGDGPYEFIADDDEKKMLLDWWKLVGDSETGMCIAHNFRFDLGFIIRRSWLNGISVPMRFIQNAESYNPSMWGDTMKAWQLGDRQLAYVSLERLAAGFGVAPYQGEVTGKEFWKWWAKDKQACIDYNRWDVDATRECWWQMGGV